MLLFGVGAALGALLWRRLVHPVPPAPQRWWPRLLGIFGMLLLFVIVGRASTVWIGAYALRTPLTVTDFALYFTKYILAPR